MGGHLKVLDMSSVAGIAILELTVTITEFIAAPLLRLSVLLANSFAMGISSVGATSDRFEVNVFLVRDSESSLCDCRCAALVAEQVVMGLNR